MRRNSYTAATSVLVFASALALISCSESGGASDDTIVVGSCNTPATGFCVEYGASYKNAKLQRLCESQKGEYSAGACPAEGRVGSCEVKKDGKSSSTYRYYAGFPGYGVTPEGGPAAAAELQCGKSIKGEWRGG